MSAVRGPALTIADVKAGEALPEWPLDVSATLIVSAALASRDFEPVHHDREAANASGMKDVFLNILATNGLAQRYVTDWSGADAIVRSSSIRLGVPHFAGERLTFTGTVESVEDNGDVEIAVRGRNLRGDHCTGKVVVNLPGGAAGVAPEVVT